ncbi:MAG: succinate dehydrogenase cytochrome b subunit [Desulfuromonadales bacterium]|nr:succinate dehydrogenase cytochrome b subunit [Desulfuromonadales bacterium]
MQWYTSSLGKKYFMAVTGLMMVLFVVAHMFGNFTIFAGADGINAYAAHLRAIPPLLWIFRLVMVGVVLLHIWLGVNLYLENKAARPVEYAMKKNERTSFSARTMVWTGLLLGAFIIYHILHFTTHMAISPGIAAGVGANFDPLNRPDVFKMVVSSFNSFGIALIYVAAMVVLLLHLAHGIQSFFQSLGATNDRVLPVFEKWGRGVAFVLMIGFVLVPISIFFGVIKL